MIAPLDARDPGLLGLQRKLLGVLQAAVVRTAPEGRDYHRADPSLLERYDAAARALAGGDDGTATTAGKHAREFLAAAQAVVDGEAIAQKRRPRSVTDLLDDPAKRFGTFEAAEHGTGLHRHLAKYFAQGGMYGDEFQRFEWHPLYGAATIEAQNFLDHFYLTPLFVEQPLVGVAPSGEEIYGKADLIAANERRELVVADWSASVARPEKLLQVAGYLGLLSYMWFEHRSEFLPLCLGYVVGLGRDFDPGLLTCVRRVEPRHLGRFIEILQRDRAA